MGRIARPSRGGADHRHLPLTCFVGSRAGLDGLHPVASAHTETGDLYPRARCGRGHHAVPSVPHGPHAPRDPLPTKRPSGASHGYLISPPAGDRPHSSRRPATCEGPPSRSPRGLRRPSGTSRCPRCPSSTPYHLPASLRRASGRLFPRPHASDTIPIASRPALPFNPVYPAGLLVPSRTCAVCGPLDKGLIR